MLVLFRVEFLFEGVEFIAPQLENLASDGVGQGT